MMSEFLTKQSLDELVGAFEQLAEELTPYFQERLNSLPPQQARVVQSLCNAEGALTVKAVAEDTFIAERNCSKHLGELKKKGYVVSTRRGKESYYEMAEPLMRLCLEVKNQRGRPLRLIALFLRAWFPVEVLKSSEGNRLFAESRGDSYRAYALQMESRFEEMIQGELFQEIEAKRKCGAYHDALSLADELEHVDLPRSLYIKAYLNLEAGMLEEEISCLTKLINIPGLPIELQAEALNHRGVAHGEQGNFDLELVDYTAVVKMSDASAKQRGESLFNRGAKHGEQGNIDLALTDYTAVIEMPDTPVEQRAKALINRGGFYWKMERFM
jgi:tetratricopeptide (TPR) repeat protein